MSPAAAAFWSTREHLLHPGKDISEVFEDLEAEWDEDEDGELPTEDGSPQLDPNLEECECQIVYQGINICLPLELFGDSAALSDLRGPDKPGLDAAEGNHTRFGLERWGTAGHVVLPLHELASWSAAVAAAGNPFTQLVFNP
jgi:hypothetical protein